MAALKTYFDFLAEDSGELQRPHPVRFKRHAGKQPRRLPRDLSDASVAQVWNTISAPRDRAWFALMWRAGLRVGEVVRLRLTDVLAPPQAEQPARLRVSGKGQTERVVLLTADAYAVLQAWLQIRPVSEQPYVFLNDRGQCLAANGIEWLLHRYGELTGVSVTPHQLRHTLATRLLNAGMDITRIQKLLGHEHLDTTLIYARVLDTTVEADYCQAMRHIERQQMPLSDTPLPMANWPTRVAARVEAARGRQRKRFASHDSRVVCNANMTPTDVRIFCKLDATGQSLIRAATRSEQFQLSARAFHRVLKIARTIAPGSFQGLRIWRGMTKSPRRTLRLCSGQVWPRRFTFGRPRRQE